MGLFAERAKINDERINRLAIGGTKRTKLCVIVGRGAPVAVNRLLQSSNLCSVQSPRPRIEPPQEKGAARFEIYCVLGLIDSAGKENSRETTNQSKRT